MRTYLDVLDEDFHRFDLPAPSTHIHALLLCRAINLGSHIHRDASIREARTLMLAQVLESCGRQGLGPNPSRYSAKRSAGHCSSRSATTLSQTSVTLPATGVQSLRVHPDR